jgi:hypothetical protein
LSQAQIEKCHVEQPLGEHIARPIGVGRFDNLMAHAFQRGSQRPSQAGFIVDNQYVHPVDSHIGNRDILHFARCVVQLAMILYWTALSPVVQHPANTSFTTSHDNGHGDCVRNRRDCSSEDFRRTAMDLTIWLLLLFLLGLATFALLFAFLAGCERI